MAYVSIFQGESENAIELYQQAIALDGEFGSAAGLSVGYLIMVISNFTDDPEIALKSNFHAEASVIPMTRILSPIMHSAGLRRFLNSPKNPSRNLNVRFPSIRVTPMPTMVLLRLT